MPSLLDKPVRRVFFENKDAFELLVFGSYGTKYSNFLGCIINMGF